ncbi:MAG: hypothetical protein ACR5LB_04715 [Wolbachia sp.]
MSSNLGKTFVPTMQKFMEDGDINIHVSASTPSKQRRNSWNSGVSSCSDVSGRTSDDEDGVIEEKMKDTFPKLPACAYKPALFLKPSKEKINELLSKNSYKALTSTPAQSIGRKSTPIWSPLNHNTVCIGKEPFNLENSMSSSSSSCSEKSNISDISDKSNNSNIVRCNITKSNTKQDLRKPDASYKQDTSSGVSEVNVDYVRNRVKRLIDQFKQSGRS